MHYSVLNLYTKRNAAYYLKLLIINLLIKFYYDFIIVKKIKAIYSRLICYKPRIIINILNFSILKFLLRLARYRSERDVFSLFFK